MPCAPSLTNVQFPSARLDRRIESPARNRTAAPTLSLADAPMRGAMSAIPTEGDDSHGKWWSAPQAVVWISTRSDKAVVEAAGDLAFRDAIRRRNLRRMSSLLPVSVDGSLPVPLEAAPVDLLRAAYAERLKIMGRKWGSEEPETVPIAADFSVVDYYEEREGYCRATIGDPASAIGKINYNYRYTNYWQHLYVSAAECRAYWPASIASAKDDAPAVTGEKAAPPRRRTGRPVEWDWPAAMAHLTAIANSPNGLPDVQADAERMVEKYFADRNDGNSPAIGGIREKVGPVYQAIAKMKAERVQGRKVDRPS
jgi:hypothetical protein